MKIVIMLFIFVGGSIAFSAWLKNRSTSSPSAENQNDLDTGSSIRTCLACGYNGEMKTWIPNYKAPKLFAVLGFMLGYIPGLIFLAIYWGKYKCPSCGAIGKSQQARDLP
jgi:predicted RNA-binding Zn-ribbon protein involved in translation (DUF1610 family)